MLHARVHACVQIRGDLPAAAASRDAPARRHLTCFRRGALQAVPGLCREAERDPREARRRRPLGCEPGVLRAPRAQGRSDLRDRRHQEPRALLRHLGGGGGEPDGAFGALVQRDFGSVATWRADLKATGIAGRGWAWTAYDWDEGRLFNYIGDAQNSFPVWNATPLVALDVYEHAYFLDYQTDRASYIEAFFANVDWDVVNGWVEQYGIPS